jgi:hypothetical protein
MARGAIVANPRAIAMIACAAGVDSRAALVGRGGLASAARIIAMGRGGVGATRRDGTMGGRAVVAARRVSMTTPRVMAMGRSGVAIAGGVVAMARGVMAMARARAHVRRRDVVVEGERGAMAAGDRARERDVVAATSRAMARSQRAVMMERRGETVGPRSPRGPPSEPCRRNADAPA